MKSYFAAKQGMFWKDAHLLFPLQETSMESAEPRDRQIQGLQCTVTDVLFIMSVRIHISMVKSEKY